MNKLEKNLQKFLKSLTQSGVLEWVEKLKKEFPESEVYLVGGAVRDAILGVRDNKDYDFVVRGVPMRKLERFLSKLGWVELLGKNFGVLKFRPRKIFTAQKSRGTALDPFDIALPRSEFSTGQGGYKDFRVKFNKDLNIEQDLLRRDFTINAMAVKLDEKSFCHPEFISGSRLKTMGCRNKFGMTIKVIDPFGGIDDIKRKIIRCVSESKERLSEDYTRILRAVRLSCQLNFEIEQKTKTTIKKLAPHLNDSLKSRQVKVRGGYKNITDFISPREVVAKELLQAFLENHVRAFDLYDKLGLFKVLMPEALKMKNCPQPKNFHSEGDVWQHTRLALEKVNSQQFKMFEKKLNKIIPSARPRISNGAGYLGERGSDDQQKLELIFGLLFHDLGKPYTIETPTKDGVDRIRFYEHDNVGADLAGKICQRLVLSSPAKLGIDCENLAWLVRKHMILIHGHPSQFRPTTVEKYFFSEKFPGKNLIKLSYCDILATIPKSGKQDFGLINALLKRMKEMKSLVKKKQAKQILPAPLLNGDEIMRILKIKPGKKVGEIKEKLREKQLIGEIKNKKEAKEFLLTDNQ